jgi:hypothetical protein
MNREQKDNLTNQFISQFKIINDMIQNLECELYTCFEEEEEIQKVFKKLEKLQKLKIALIKIYSTIISEF